MTYLGDVPVLRVLLVRTVMLGLLDPLALLYVSPNAMLLDISDCVLLVLSFLCALLCRDLLERRESRDLLDLMDSRYLFGDQQCRCHY